MDAIDSRVFLANPMTLIGVLRAVAYVLDQERLNQNALEVSDLGRKLYESIRVYGAHVTRLGRHLRQTVDAYNDSVGSLERNVLSKARQLRAKGGDQLPGTVSVDTLPGSFRSAELVLEEESDVALAEA
jgi:DNA recombination protein RmuC